MTGDEDQAAAPPGEPPAFNPDPHLVVPSIKEDTHFRPTNDQSSQPSHDE